MNYNFCKQITKNEITNIENPRCNPISVIWIFDTDSIAIKPFVSYSFVIDRPIGLLVETILIFTKLKKIVSATNKHHFLLCIGASKIMKYQIPDQHCLTELWTFQIGARRADAIQKWVKCQQISVKFFPFSPRLE
mgnify:CR=1 FL=1